MIKDKAVVVVEAVSNGVWYVNDILARGYVPVCIFPELVSVKPSYEQLRHNAVSSYEDKVVIKWAASDVKELISFLEQWEVLAVVAGSEQGVNLCDKLAETLGLPGNVPDALDKRRNKFQMQRALEKAGLRCIRGRMVTSVQEAISYWNELNVPKVVLKPVSSAGSDGVHFCSNIQELEQNMLFLASDADMFGNPNAEVLMQEYIAGTEYIVNTLSCDGIHTLSEIFKYHKVAIGDKGNAYDKAEAVCRLDLGLVQMVQYAYSVADALGVKYGPVHGEYMLTETGPVLIEMGARIMGGHFFKTSLDKVFGHHMTDRALDCYLNQDQFEKVRKEPYRPQGSLILKLLIAPITKSFNALACLPVLRCLPSFQRIDVAGALEEGRVEQTVDLFSSPASIQLYHEDPHVVQRDDEVISMLEWKYFNLMFSSDKPENEKKVCQRELIRLLKQICRPDSIVLCGEKDQKELKCAVSCQVVTLSDLSEGQKSDMGVFVLTDGGLEEFGDAFRMFVGQIKKGGIIAILPELYAPEGRKLAMLSVLSRVLEVELMVPRCDEKDWVLGNVTK